jgi:hypothetical protein
MPKALAASTESIMKMPGLSTPLVTTTVTRRPFSRFVTSTLVLRGKELHAAKLPELGKSPYDPMIAEPSQEEAEAIAAAKNAAIMAMLPYLVLCILPSRVRSIRVRTLSETARVKRPAGSP